MVFLERFHRIKFSQSWKIIFGRGWSFSRLLVNRLVTQTWKSFWENTATSHKFRPLPLQVVCYLHRRLVCWEYSGLSIPRFYTAAKKSGRLWCWVHTFQLSVRLSFQYEWVLAFVVLLHVPASQHPVASPPIYSSGSELAWELYNSCYVTECWVATSPYRTYPIFAGMYSIKGITGESSFP